MKKSQYLHLLQKDDETIFPFQLIIHPLYFSDYYNQAVTTYPYSVEEAINYLVQAGFNITINESTDVEDTSFSIISSAVGLGFATPVAVFITKKRKRK